MEKAEDRAAWYALGEAYVQQWTAADDIIKYDKTQNFDFKSNLKKATYISLLLKFV